MSQDPISFGAVRVFTGPRGGAYPHANSLLVHGTDAAVVIDPSLAVLDATPPADLVLVSHAHEDHVAGLGGYSAAPVHAHHADLAAVRSPAAMVAGYGLPPDVASAAAPVLFEEFRLHGRPDAAGFADGTVFDLGGRTVTVVHLPGHTAGHSGFLIEPDGFFFVADIDLTSIGPMYGDLTSDLGDLEDSIRQCRDIEARWYGTSHQVGVIEGASEFRRRLDAFEDVVARRDAALLALLGEPRTLQQILEHRLVYRPHVQAPHVPTVERRTATQHLDRLKDRGLVAEVEPGLFRTIAS